MRPPTAIGPRRQSADGSNASRRSATTRASAASSSCSTRIASAASARVRQAPRRGGAAGRDRAGIRQRMGDPVMSHATVITRRCRRCWRPAAAGLRTPRDRAARRGARRSTSRAGRRQTELFMEYPPLVAGQTVRFAVHLTRLADFSALNAGRPSIEMTPERGGPPSTLPGSEPLRPGAFRVEGHAAARRPVSLGAARRRARPLGPHDLGVDHRVRRRGGGGRRRREAARGRSGGHRVPEGAAVDQCVRDRPWCAKATCARRSACRRRSSR